MLKHCASVSLIRNFRRRCWPQCVYMRQAYGHIAPHETICIIRPVKVGAVARSLVRLRDETSCGPKGYGTQSVCCFISLAETPNFAAAATAERRFAAELDQGHCPFWRKSSAGSGFIATANIRLTALGRDVEMEFWRMRVALRSVRQYSDNWALGRHRVLDVALASTVRY